VRMLVTMVLCLFAVTAAAGTDKLDRAAQRDLLISTADLVQREYIFEGIATTTADELKSIAGGEETAASRTPGEFAPACKPPPSPCSPGRPSTATS
jgi:hypothetical protein